MLYKVKAKLEMITYVEADNEEMAKETVKDVFVSTVIDMKTNEPFTLENSIEVEILDKEIDKNIINDEIASRVEDELEQQYLNKTK